MLNHSILRIKLSSKNPANLAFSISFRKHFYAIRFYLRAIDNYLAERTGSSCVRFSSKREKTNMYTRTRICKKRPSVETDRTTFAKYLLLSRLPPSLSHNRPIAAQSSVPVNYCPDQSRTTSCFPCRSRLRLIRFEITFNLVHDFIRSAERTREHTVDGEQRVACCDVRQSTPAQQMGISSLFYLPTYASALSSIPRCGIKR